VTFTDKTLRCRECGEDFVFTAGEQGFYAEKGLLNQPQRCPACRAQRRRERGGGVARTMYPVTCAHCGAETTVPFFPKNNRPVYCSACYERVKNGLLEEAASE
jgi:CxxC-x17-CxxC domain-containing protein